MTFQLGAHVGQQNMEMSTMRAVWRRLDEAGLDWISVWDHLYEAPPAGGTQPHFEAIATLGALCVETKRARLGTLVFYVGYDFPSLGTRFAMLEEAFPLIRDLLDPDIERVTHEGRFFRTFEASCLPPPVGGRRLPIWIGGTGPRKTPSIAARHADGWNGAYISPAQFRRRCEALDAECDKIGRDPATLERSANLMFMLSVDAAAEARMRRQLDEQWGERAAHVGAGALLGTPEAAVEKILAYRDAGAQGVNIALRAPWDEDALSAYLELVVPAVRRELGETV